LTMTPRMTSHPGWHGDIGISTSQRVFKVSVTLSMV